MKERVQGCVSVGVAMVGAGALALAPMAPQPAVQMRAAEVKVNLLAETLPTTLQAKLAELGAGVGESGLRLAQSSLQGLLGPIALAQALGDDEAVKAIIADYVDGPLYIADPTIFALDNVLPKPFGGDTSDTPQQSQGSDVLKFRVQVLYALREAIKDALGVQPSPSLFAASAVAANPVGDPVFTVTRLAQGFAESGARLAESGLSGLLGPIALVQALGDDEAVKAIIANYIDGPLYVADPAIFAIDDVLPAPFGQDPAPNPQLGNTSVVLAFRANVLYVLREQIKDALGVQPSPNVFAASAVAPDPVGDPVFTVTRLAKGLGESGERLLTDAALGLLGPVAAAQALAKGDNEGLYKVVESYVDAPLHIADPTIFAIDDVLPKPFGGDPSTDPKAMNGSIVSNIRADVLIPARDAIKPGLKNVLGVPKPTTDATVKTAEKPAAQLATGSDTATKKPTSHRKPTNNPISSALKQLSKEVKKATEPKHAKPSAE
jgi:hypothetical protein